MKKSKRLSVNEYVSGIKGNNKSVLSRAITLIESSLLQDRILSHQVLDALKTKNQSIRIGITGSPGVGKSTFIDALSKIIINEGKKIAVLSIDPSSPESGGSILGDKTRMEFLSQNENAFIRPSPSGKTQGGLNSTSRESMLLCEAAGYDIVIIETVGVGQSETDIKMLSDHFLLLIQPASGDELQGIKKGIVELADLLIVNKADGALKKSADITKSQYGSALSTIHGHRASDVFTCSSIDSTGLPEIWAHIKETHSLLEKNGDLSEKRTKQKKAWFQKALAARALEKFLQDSETIEKLNKIEVNFGKTDYEVHHAIHDLFEKS